MTDDTPEPAQSCLPQSDRPSAAAQVDPMDVDMVAAQLDLPDDHRSGFVAVIGRPNVGKSTLLNHLLGQKIAIVSDKPQTTRDQLLGIRTDGDAQYIFLDTPGIHRPHHKLGKHMVRVAEETISNDADLLLWLVEANEPLTQEEMLIIERLHSLNDEMPLPPLLIGLNKIDEGIQEPGWLQTVEDLFSQKLEWLLQDEEGQDRLHLFPISAATGEGVDKLLQAVRDHLPIGPRFYPQELVTDLNMRFLVAELIREQALHHLRQEVPHSVAVAVTEFEKRPDNMLYIAATVYVERSSQKGIVLGRKGSMIKRIGQDARPQIEDLVESKVYLELWVKVWEGWRRRDNMLQRLGYDQQT